MLRLTLFAGALVCALLVLPWLSQFSTGAIGDLSVEHVPGGVRVRAPVEGWPAKQVMAARRVGQLLARLEVCDRRECSMIPAQNVRAVSVQTDPSNMYRLATTNVEWTIACPARVSRIRPDGMVTSRLLEPDEAVHAKIAYGLAWFRFETRSPDIGSVC